MRTEQERMELIRKRTLEIRKKEKKRMCSCLCAPNHLSGHVNASDNCSDRGYKDGWCLWGSCQHFWHKQCTGVYRDGNNLLFHRSLRNSPFISVT